MIRRTRHLAILVPLLLAMGCSGFSASNVGDPSLQDKLDFRSNLALLHVGMPADSFDLLFAPALKPGDTGIVHKVRIATIAGERISYELGWLSEPLHQTGHKPIEEITVIRAWVQMEQGRISGIRDKG